MCSNPETVERLFLLEILVDTVHIEFSKLNLNDNAFSQLGQTCVRFQFLSYPALEIYDENYDPNVLIKEDIHFKKGKSCLFALRGQNPPAFTPPFNMFVTVLNISPKNRCCTLGKACIKLGECFATIISCSVVCPTSPTTKTVRNTYPLYDDNNCEVGRITVFIRLSCFGKVIVTQFQLGGLENKSFLFRAESEIAKVEEKVDRVLTPTEYREGNPIAAPETFCEMDSLSLLDAEPRCQPMGGMTGMGMPGMGMGMPGMGLPNMGMPMGPPPMMGGGMMPPPFMGGGGFIPPMGGPAIQMMPLTNMGEIDEQMPDSKDYKELTASVNGHELSVKILRKPKKPKKFKVIPSSQVDGGKASGGISIDKFCDCAVDFPPDLLGLSAGGKRGKMKKTMENKTPYPFANENNNNLNIPIPMGASIPQINQIMPKKKKVRKPVKPANVRENFILRLGDCPPICCTVPKPPPMPCTTERDSQFVQEDQDIATKLFSTNGHSGGDGGGDKGKVVGGKKKKKK